MIIALIVVLALVALVALWRDRPPGGRRWTGDSYASFAVGAMIVGGVIYDSDSYGGSRVLQSVTLACIVAGTVCYLATAGRERLFVAPTLAFLPMLMALYMFVLSAAGSSDIASFSRLAPVVMWACLGALLSSSGVSVVTMSRMIVGITCTMAVLLPAVDGAMTACTEFKCGLFGELLKGPTASGNYLAQFAGMSMLVALFRMRGTLRVAVVSAMVLILVATDSRTSQIAVATGLAIGLLIKFRPGRNSRGPLAYQTMALLAWPTVIAGSALGLYLIYTFDDGDFSNRANTWARGVAVLDNRWPTGLGSEAWSAYQDLGALPILFPHSQYLLLLFWGGMFAVLAYTVLLAVTACRATRMADLLPLCCAMVMFMLTLGLTEAFWNPAAVDGHSFFIVFVLAFAYPSVGTADASVPDVTPAAQAVGAAGAAPAGGHRVVPNTEAGAVPARAGRHG